METKKTSLQQLLEEEISRLAAAELQLKKNLPHWIDKVQSLSLKTILQNYKNNVAKQIKKLRGLHQEEFDTNIVNDKIMQAYIDVTNEKLLSCEPGIRDASLLEAIQAISCYKIHAYNSASAWALILESPREATTLNDAGINEKNMDERLYYLAVKEINRKARAPIELFA
jgi:ferritin-like metal-binding protein YciE